MGLHRANPKPLIFTTQSHLQPSEIWEKHSKRPKLWCCFDFLSYLHMRPIPFIRHCLWSAPFPWKASCIYLKLQRVPVNFLETPMTLCLVGLWGGSMVWWWGGAALRMCFLFCHAAEEPGTRDCIFPYLHSPHTVHLQALLFAFWALIGSFLWGLYRTWHAGIPVSLGFF